VNAGSVPAQRDDGTVEVIEGWRAARTARRPRRHPLLAVVEQDEMALAALMIQVRAGGHVPFGGAGQAASTAPGTGRQLERITRGSRSLFSAAVGWPWTCRR
jgi:hypothetical protein